MEISIKTHHILTTVIALCVLIVVGDWIRAISTEAFVAFIGTLIATFIGVGAAAYINVWRFYSEAEETDRAKSQLLAESLAGELSTVLDILGGNPNVVIRDPTGGTNHIPVVFAQLEPTATEEAIRIGLLGSQSTANLSQLSNLMRDYTKASDNLYPLVTAWYQDENDLTPLKPAYKVANEVERLRQNLVIWCEAVLSSLKSQGIQMPHDPQFRTDPARVVTYRTGPPPS